MTEPPRPGTAAAACGGSAGPGARIEPPVAALLDADMIVIVRALADRARYRYVMPRVERAGNGWQIVSPNCSRNVDPDGGEIPIALFEPAAGLWNLYARDHRRAQWRLQATGLPLADAAVRVALDPLGLYWP